MSIQRLVAALLVLAFTAGCASLSSRPVRSEFEDIPVPKGLSYQPRKSTVIESPTVKAARRKTGGGAGGGAPAAPFFAGAAPPPKGVSVVKGLPAGGAGGGPPPPGPPLGKCYGLRQLPPSCEMKESASAGPQVPAS